MNPVRIIALSSLGIPLSLLLVAAIRRYALRERKLDIPGQRSSHNEPTPRGGGLAIVVTTVTLLLLGTSSGTDVPFRKVIALVTAGMIIAGIGLLDDWEQLLSATIRLGVHFTIALVFVVISGVVTALYLPPFNALYLGPVLGGTITLFWLVGLINIYNFMDGCDGLAGTQAFLSGSAWAFLFLLEQQETLAFLAGLLAASSLGFLVLNVPPAKIFMGDVGSTFLGFCLSALPVIAFAEMKNPRLMVTGILMVGVFVFDATFTLLRRARNGEDLLEAHSSHLYQRLIKLGYSHAEVCARYAFLMAISATSGLVFYFAESHTIALGTLIGVLGLYLGLAGWVTWRESDRVSGSQSHIKLTTTHKLETDR